MLTGNQIRAGRALLNWHQTQLSDNSDVSIATLRRIEGESGVPSVNAQILEKLENSFNSAGVFFENNGRDIVVRMQSCK